MVQARTYLCLFLLILSPLALAQDLIDINTATAEQLETLPGIGPKKAQAIIEDRKAHGPFKGVDDLVRVPGIGAKTLERIRALVTAGPPEPEGP